MKYLSGIISALVLAGAGHSATYTWTQGGDPTNWEDTANWQGGLVIPKTEVNADLVFGPATTGKIGTTPNSARMTVGSLAWSTNATLDNFAQWSSPSGIVVDTGSSADATATFTEGGFLSAVYVTWQLNNNLVLSGTGPGGGLLVRAYNPSGVIGTGGFIVESGELRFQSTHGNDSFTFTGGVFVKNGGLVNVDSLMGALGDGLLTIEEGGIVEGHNSTFDQDVLFRINSASSANPFITGSGSNWNASGTWSFDLTDAGTNVGSSWAIIADSAASYDQTDFSIAGFTEDSPGVWTGSANGANYQYDESTGMLTVIANNTPENVAPGIFSLSPEAGAEGVLRESNLVLKFDEPITLLSGGTITITNLTENSTTAVITLPDPQVTSPKGNDLVINLDSDLRSLTNYSIRISANAVQDQALTPNAFPGILDDTTWYFRTETADLVAPTISSLLPALEQTRYLPWKNLSATFDEPITLNDGGTITINDLTDGSSTEVITLPDPRVTSPNGDDLLIDLVASLDFGTEYSIQISGNAIQDRADVPNAFAGIQDDLTWRFSTKDEAATIHNVLLVAISYDNRPPNRSIEEAERIMFENAENIDDGLRYASYNQIGLHLGDGSGLDPTVTFDYPASAFTGNVSPATLRDRAAADLIAMGYDMSISNYRFVLYITPGGFNNKAGTAAIGSQWSNYQDFSTRVIMHELGHCLGGNHSVRDPACALGWATWNYAPEKKLKFGWMDPFPETTTTLTQGTSLSLVPFAKDPATTPGLRIATIEAPDLETDGHSDAFHITYMVSEAPYASFDSQYSPEVFITWDRGATLSSHRATLAQGETYNHSLFTVTCDSIAGDRSSAEVTIRLSSDPPEVTNTEATDVSSTSAIIGGTLSALGQSDVSIYWGPGNGGTDALSWANVVPLGSLSEGNFSSSITGLTPGNTYFYRAFASNEGGQTWAPTTGIFDAAFSSEVIFRQQYGLNVDGSQDFEDWSDNGVANVFYYLFGLGDPDSPQARPLTLWETPAPGMPVSHADPGGDFIFSYVNHKTQTGFRQRIIVSEDLGTWLDIDDQANVHQPDSVSIVPIDADMEIRRLHFSQPPNQLFLSVEVESAGN